MSTAIAIPYHLCRQCGRQVRGFSCQHNRVPWSPMDLVFGASVFGGLCFMPKMEKTQERLIMKLPEGKEREVIEEGIECWRRQKKESYRRLLEYGLYNMVEKYLPDTSTTMGFLATMAPTMLGVLVDLKRFESDEVAIWADDKDEILFGSPKDSPEDAIQIPYALLNKLLEIHGMNWVATSTMEKAAWDQEPGGHTSEEK
jgi:hypothetical protein